VEAAVELSLAIATATVLGCAGVLKLADAGPFRYRALGVAEVGVAVALLVDRSRLGGLILGCGLGLVFTSYSLVHVERPCRCFGERFRVAGTARLVRPVAITAFSLGALLVWSFGATEATETSRALTSAVIGVILGCVVIAAPAVASPPEQPSELPSHPEVSTRV